MTEMCDEKAQQMRPYVRIIEQPSSRVKFRYKVEGYSRPMPIPGINSSSENKTFPSIEIVGYNGAALVIVSCVTKDPPYRAHPHEIVGSESCLQGVCKMNIPDGHSRIITFPKLSIQCVKKKDAEDSLRLREQIKIDPLKRFEQPNQSTSIDHWALRLCFQVILKNGPGGEYGDALEPVVSHPIVDKIVNNELNIVKMSDCECPVDGGKKDIIILCGKLGNDDIKIRFFEEKEGFLVWEAFVDLNPSQVYKQYAIWFRPPKYAFLNITEPVKVNVELFKPSDGSRSNPVPFDLLPLPIIENTSNQNTEMSNQQTRKKPKLMDFNNFSSNIDGLQMQHCQLNVPNDTIEEKLGLPGENFISPSGGQAFFGPPREFSPQKPTIPAILQTFEQPSSSNSNVPLSLSEIQSQTPQNHTPEYLGLSDVNFDSGLLEMANPQELKSIVLNSGELEK